MGGKVPFWHAELWATFLPPLLLRLFASGQAFAKQNYRALPVMICLFLYSRWLEAESTPLPLSSMCTSGRRLFLPYSCFQPKEAGGVTLTAEHCHGVNLSLQTAAVGSNQKGQIQMPATCMGIFPLSRKTRLCKRAAPLPACLFSVHWGREGELGCVRQVTSKGPVS